MQHGIDWATILQYSISGAIVSWPGVVAGFWLNWRKTRSHIDQATREQTEHLEARFSSLSQDSRSGPPV